MHPLPVALDVVQRVEDDNACLAESPLHSGFQAATCDFLTDRVYPEGQEKLELADTDSHAPRQGLAPHLDSWRPC